MKTPIASLILLLVLPFIGSAQKKTVIEGHFNGTAPQNVTVVLPASTGTVDTLVAVKDGAFTISLTVDKTVTGYFTFASNEGDISKAFVSDGSKLRYTIDGEGISMVSSNPKSLNYELMAFFDKQAEVRQKVRQDPNSYDELIAFCKTMYENNLDNGLGLLAFNFVIQKEDDDAIEEMIGRFSPEMQAKPALQDRLKRIQTKRATQEGGKFKDIEATRPDGSVRRLSDYIGHGKYVVVDFWASWCGPCRGETPYLKAAYAKYAGPKFDIVGVTVNDKAKNAKALVEKENIPWDQLYIEDGRAATIYGFSSIPQIFLFGPDGTLLKREGLRGEGIDQILSEYLR
jgi:thiol-disulfide isomerase/thioredoxin